MKLKKVNIRTKYIVVAIIMGCAFFFYWGMQVSKRKIFPYSIINTVSGLNPSAHSVISALGCDLKIFQIEHGNYQVDLINKKVPFAPRDGAGAVVLNDELYLIGGWNPYDKKNFPNLTSNDVWKSSDYGITWRQIKRNTYDKNFTKSNDDWEGRHNAGYIIKDGYIYIVGGDVNSAGDYVSDIWRSKDGVNWQLVNAKPPFSPRVKSLTFVYRDNIYVVGGQTDTLRSNEIHNETYYRDIWKSGDGFDWAKLDLNKSNIFFPRGGYGGSGFVLNDKVYIIGGFTDEGLVSKNRNVWIDVWSSKDDLTEWYQVGLTPVDYKGNGVLYHDTAVYDNKLWIIGGFRSDLRNTNDVWYSNAGDKWSSLKCIPFPPTHSTSVWSTSKGIVVAAGNGWSDQVFMIMKR